VHVTVVARLRLIEIEERDGTRSTLRTTDEHPFYVLRSGEPSSSSSPTGGGEGGGWVKAADLQAGQKLLTPEGIEATVLSSTYEAHPEGITVYNLTVDGDHT
jgi:intein/homing endonuclease